MPIYKDTPQNRRLKRVGMGYGKECSPCEVKKKESSPKPKPAPKKVAPKKESAELRKLKGKYKYFKGESVAEFKKEMTAQYNEQFKGKSLEEYKEILERSMSRKEPHDLIAIPILKKLIAEKEKKKGPKKRAPKSTPKDDEPFSASSQAANKKMITNMLKGKDVSNLAASMAKAGIKYS
mgnify:CR=1 FL=1